MRPLVLVYHGVPRRENAGAFYAASFERQIAFLNRHCTFVSPEEYPTAQCDLMRPSVLLTFDDGLRNNAEVVAPILRRFGIPAVFFVSSRHCVDGEYLWFTYLNMLRWYFRGSSVTLNGVSISLAGDRRESGIKELTNRLLGLKPHPQAMYDAIRSQLPRLSEFVPDSILADECYGMTDEQASELAKDPLFTIGAHTVDHPYLTRCDSEEIFRQLWNNKTRLERVTGRKCDLLAYPLGDFDVDVLEQCRALEFRQAFATEFASVSDQLLAIRRIGIYRPGSVLFRTKVWFGRWLPMQFIHALRSYTEA